MLSQSVLPQIAAREQSAGVTFVRSHDYAGLNYAQRIVSVPTASVQQAESVLRQQAGVKSVGVTGERRSRLTSASVVTNDSYFQGFAGTGSLQYHETAAIPGQWDMYAIGLDHAYGYSSGTGNTALGGPNPLALGSASIKIAIIDTGEDTNHPELHSKIAYQKCYITPAVGAQSSSNFTSDEDGHGTDVSGIAAADAGNALGFTGAGGNSVIYGYRVFPTPDDNCANTNTTDQQCSSSTSDIAAAINDAVLNHVNVISMSLGGGSCANGADSDTAEGAAVAAAIAANIIVVAAAGNGAPGTTGLDAPACDTGVIAVGATSLDDGTATGTSSYTTPNATAASASNIVEYVASYSQFGSPNTPKSPTSWGIVAPGGDPSNAELTGTADDLHWIENTWTTTPFGGQSDKNFAGACTGDFGNTSGPTDCRTLIAGTSMSTPHVAGAAALILAVNSTYQSPAAMKQLLCSTADDLADAHQGCGRLNVYRAMATALNDQQLP